MTYNPQRKILGVIPCGGKIAYHLFNINPGTSTARDIVKLCRKLKWHSQYSTEPGNLALLFYFIIKNISSPFSHILPLLNYLVMIYLLF